jgi:hypothetical protein
LESFKTVCSRNGLRIACLLDEHTRLQINLHMSQESRVRYKTQKTIQTGI